MKTYRQIEYGTYELSEVSVPLRASGADCGGGGEVLIVETLVFDEGSITSPSNGNVPAWGGCCHTLSGNAGRTVVIVRENNEEDEDSDGTGFDCGERGENGRDNFSNPDG